MSDLTINVIKTIKDRQSFKEVLIEVAKGFADCDFFKCADWKAILESTFNANVCAPDTTQFYPEEQNSFCQALDVTNVVGLLESDWQSALDEILNTDFTDYFESEQTNDENLLNAFYIETCMELHSAEDNIVQDREVDDEFNKDSNMLKDEKSDKKKFGSKRSVKRHIKRMHEERHYPLANQNYVSIPTNRHTDLPLNPLHTEDSTQHLKTHSDKELHICGDCKKAFSSRSNLKTHQIIHSGEKPFVCRYCQKAFSQIANLKIHERIHSGERPYICGDCQKTFNHSSNLKLHQMIHSGEKPHVCDVCQRAFSRTSCLKSHQQTHNKHDDRKQFFCAHCERSCTRKNNLKVHLTKCYKKHNSKFDSVTISKETFPK